MTEVDSSFVPLSERPAFLIAQLGFHLDLRFIDALAPLGIGPRHNGMLRLLHEHGGQTQQQLCDALHIHRNVMVGLVDELEKRGLVERRRHPSDRRAYAMYLLPAAYELLEQVEPLAGDLDTTLLETLDIDEQATLQRLLGKAAAGAGLTPGVHPGLTRGTGPAR